MNRAEYEQLKKDHDWMTAQLAKQAPLIEAVMGAERLRYVNLWKNLPTEQVFSNDGIRAILRAALKLREEKGK